MKNITIRHNKHYTSVLINRIKSAQDLLDAFQAVRQVEGLAVAKPSQKGWQSYETAVNETELKQKTPVGESFKIFGCPFKVLDQHPESHVNGQCTLEWSYTDIDGKQHDEVIEDFYDMTLLDLVYEYLTNGAFLGYVG